VAFFRLAPEKKLSHFVYNAQPLALTIEYVYPLPESHEISEEYVKRAMPVLHRRLVQAGVRLAWLLNDALKWSLP